MEVVLVVFIFVVVVLVIALVSEAPQENKEDSVTNVRLAGLKARQDVNRLGKDLRRQQMDYLREKSMRDSDSDSRGG